MKFKRNSFVQTVVAMIVAAVAAAVVAVDVIILVVVVAVVGRSQSVGDSFAVETVGQTRNQ